MKKTQIFSYLVLAIAALSLTSCMTTGYTYVRYGVTTPAVTYVDPYAPGYDNYGGGYSYSTRLSYNSSGSAGFYDYGTGTYCPSNPCNNHGHYHSPDGYHGPRKEIGSNTPRVNEQRPNVQKQSTYQKTDHQVNGKTVKENKTVERKKVAITKNDTSKNPSRNTKLYKKPVKQKYEYKRK